MYMQLVCCDVARAADAFIAVNKRRQLTSRVVQTRDRHNSNKHEIHEEEKSEVRDEQRVKNEPQLHKADLLAARLNNEDVWDVGRCMTTVLWLLTKSGCSAEA